MPKTKVFDPDIEANRLVAVMSYLWVLFLIPLLLKRRSKFAQFHAKQGLVLFILEFIIWLVAWVPLLGQVLLLWLIVMIVFGIIKAYNGEYWQMPFVYKWSEKINL